MNVTREDIVGMSGLEEHEVEAIAEHEHLPDVIAAALAQYLRRQGEGVETIRRMIRDDIRDAFDRGEREHAALLVKVLHRFTTEHPPSGPSSAAG